ncbi:hypothetical protein LB566_13945 [Mesorhizobium sp. CA13]|uniref:hypothetical protein n=1 Tax=Mesorhizobium sp. CA13 TaxID=2876643 RepID=UPI001CCC414D|nr:hypothetical protein [Mesorhizobium sp. CA13]MBZ9854907.1 hypothetical protein [Mesorhizobium sp. CA13]
MGSDKQEARGWWMVPWALAVAIAAAIGWAIQALSPATVTIGSGLLGVIAALILCLFLGTALHLYYGRPSAGLIKPRVLLFKKESLGLFVISPADWLMYGAAYTLFVAENDGFERLLGVGEVLIRQDDKNVQLLIRDRAASAEEAWKSLDGGSKDHFGKIIIKPGAPRMGWITHEAS